VTKQVATTSIAKAARNKISIKGFKKNPRKLRTQSHRVMRA